MTSWLGDFDGVRNNNFSLIRLLLAWSVLLGHSAYIVALEEKMLADFIPGHIFIGGIGVYGFFAISGFLVSASFTNRGRLEFIAGRLLRIYPALLVCILLSVMVLGPVFTAVPLKEYFTSPQTGQYLLHNATLWPRLQWNLPGVFTDHPTKAINGSLWSLPLELKCYAALFVAGVCGGFKTAVRANLVLAVIFATGYFAFKSIPFFGHNAQYSFPSAYFLAGVFFWVNRRSIPLHPAMAIAAAAVPYAVPQALVLGLPYLIFYFAYALPHIDVDRFGDFSYGMYIYAWPAQQMVFWQGQSTAVNVALATVLALALAAASWHFIEKPALRFKTVRSVFSSKLYGASTGTQP